MDPAPSPGSGARYARLQRLLEERPPRSVDDVMEIMRDHATEPQSICLHADPAEATRRTRSCSRWSPSSRKGRMWVAPGNPCQTQYEEIDLTGVR